MKIAYITTSFLPKTGGAEVMLHNLVSKLTNDYGVDATVYVSVRIFFLLLKKGVVNKFPYKVKPVLLYTIKLYSIPFLGKILARLCIFFQQYVNKYDLWHATFAYPPIDMLAFIRPLAIILRSPGDDIQINRNLGYGIRRNPRINRKVVAALKKVDSLVATTETVRAEYLKVGKFENKITIIPNGVDLERFNIGSFKEDLRRELNLPFDRKILLTVGRNHPKKGYNLIPEIARSLMKYREDFLWVIIGRGTSHIKEQSSYGDCKSFIKIIENIGIDNQDDYDIINKVNNLPPLKLIKYYNASDVFVFPSLLESFGIVLIEAMAARLPVVTTNAPGCSDVVQDGHNGLGVPSGDPEAMARAVAEILKNSELREKIIENAFIDVKKRYDWKVVTKKYFDLYKVLLKHNE